MKRISVTTLEKFRRFMASESSFDTEASLIESLKGIFTGNDKTKTGSAYHKIIEGDYIVHDNIVTVKADELLFAFTMEQAIHAIDYRSVHQNMVHEIEHRTIFETTYGQIQVTSRIDGLEGAVVHDVKTKYRAVNILEYTKSAQWKFYLHMLGLDRFFFDVFEFIGFDKLGSGSPAMLPGVIVIAHEPIECLRYEGMENENITLLHDFLGYIDNRNFWHLLKPAVTQDDLNF